MPNQTTIFLKNRSFIFATGNSDKQEISFDWESKTYTPLLLSLFTALPTEIPRIVREFLTLENTETTSVYYKLTIRQHLEKSPDPETQQLLALLIMAAEEVEKKPHFFTISVNDQSFQFQCSIGQSGKSLHFDWNEESAKSVCSALAKMNVDDINAKTFLKFLNQKNPNKSYFFENYQNFTVLQYIYFLDNTSENLHALLFKFNIFLDSPSKEIKTDIAKLITANTPDFEVKSLILRMTYVAQREDNVQLLLQILTKLINSEDNRIRFHVAKSLRFIENPEFVFYSMITEVSSTTSQLFHDFLCNLFEKSTANPDEFSHCLHLIFNNRLSNKIDRHFYLLKMFEKLLSLPADYLYENKTIKTFIIVGLLFTDELHSYVKEANFEQINALSDKLTAHDRGEDTLLATFIGKEELTKFNREVNNKFFGDISTFSSGPDSPMELKIFTSKP